MASYKISYWLLPAQEDRGYWRSAIKNLAQRLGQAPVFEPHVTIYVSADSPEQFSLENVRKAVDGITSIELSATDLDFTDQFTKSCFISFAQSEPLTQISEALQKSSITKSAYDLIPHMSLMYRHLSIKERLDVEKMVSLPTKPIVFNEVQAWATTNDPQSKNDVDSWRLIGSCMLS